MISSVDWRDLVECKACLRHFANKETEARKERNSSESQGESGLAFLIPGPIMDLSDARAAEKAFQDCGSAGGLHLTGELVTVDICWGRGDIIYLVPMGNFVPVFMWTALVQCAGSQDREEGLEASRVVGSGWRKWKGVSPLEMRVIRMHYTQVDAYLRIRCI